MHPARCPAEPSRIEVADDYAVAFVLDQPGLLDVLVAEHVDDGHGDCAACPGPQSGRRRWPCNVRLLAARAERVRAARDAGHAADAPTGREPVRPDVAPAPAGRPSRAPWGA